MYAHADTTKNHCLNVKDEIVKLILNKKIVMRQFFSCQSNEEYNNRQ